MGSLLLTTFVHLIVDALVLRFIFRYPWRDVPMIDIVVNAMSFAVLWMISGTATQIGTWGAEKIFGLYPLAATIVSMLIATGAQTLVEALILQLAFEATLTRWRVVALTLVNAAILVVLGVV